MSSWFNNNQQLVVDHQTPFLENKRRSILSNQVFRIIALIGVLVLLSTAVFLLVVFSNKNQDIRQSASGGSCSVFSNPGECSLPGCSWQLPSCVNYSATKTTCETAGCTWNPVTTDCGSFTSQSTCGDKASLGCYWKWNTISCSIDDCSQPGCNLQRFDDYHTCSVNDNNCSQVGCTLQTGCSGSYQGTAFCSGKHHCGSSACNSYSNQTACEDSCCTWNQPVYSCLGFGKSSCQSKNGCTWHENCSGSYVTARWECTGSYQGTTGTCLGGVIETSGTCTGTPSVSTGYCEGTIQIMPSNTPLPTATSVPTNTPTPSPTMSNIPNDCQIITDATSCPVGTIRDDTCHSLCQQSNIICCVAVDPKDQCTRNQRECSTDNQKYRYCVVNDPAGNNGRWGQWFSCAAGQTCLVGVCLHPTPTSQPTATPEFGGECDEGDRECNGNSYRYCIYDPTTGVAGLWSALIDCGENADCMQGVCVQHTPVPSLTPTPAPYHGGGNCLWGQRSCPEGMQASSNCSSECVSPYAVCCESTDAENRCNINERECGENNTYRACLSSGVWSDWLTCAQGSVCNSGVCITHTQGVGVTTTTTPITSTHCAPNNPCPTGSVCINGGCVQLSLLGENENNTVTTTPTVQYTTPAGAITVASCAPNDTECQRLHEELNLCHTEQECREAVRSLYATLGGVAAFAVLAPLAIPAGATALASTVSLASVGTTSTMGVLANMPLAAYSQITAAMASIPLWAQRGLAISGLVSKTYGLMKGATSCQTNPYSNECMMTMTGIQVGAFDDVFQTADRGLTRGIEQIQTVPGRITEEYKERMALRQINLAARRISPVDPYINPSDRYITLYKGIPARAGYAEGTDVLRAGEAQVLSNYDVGGGIRRTTLTTDAGRHALTGVTGNSPFSSWTTRFDTALDYAGEGGTLIKFELPKGNTDVLSMRELVAGGHIDYRAMAASFGYKVYQPDFLQTVLANIHGIDYNYEYLLDIQVSSRVFGTVTVPFSPVY